MHTHEFTTVAEYDQARRDLIGAGIKPRDMILERCGMRGEWKREYLGQPIPATATGHRTMIRRNLNSPIMVSFRLAYDS